MPFENDLLVKRHTLAPSCVSAKSVPDFWFLQLIVVIRIKAIAWATSTPETAVPWLQQAAAAYCSQNKSQVEIK